MAADQEVYKPSPEIVAAANVKSYEEMARCADADLAGFWSERAQEFEWFKPWDKVLDDSNKPFYKWFVGAQTNIAYNCLDRHVKTWRRNKLALIWEGEKGDVRTFSYHALNREVCMFANVLRSMGGEKGRPGDNLHGPHPRTAHRHVGLRQNRRGTFGGLWRVFRRGAAWPHRR